MPHTNIYLDLGGSKLNTPDTNEQIEGVFLLANHQHIHRRLKLLTSSNLLFYNHYHCRKGKSSIL